MLANGLLVLVAAMLLVPKRPSRCSEAVVPHRFGTIASDHVADFCSARNKMESSESVQRSQQHKCCEGSENAPATTSAQYSTGNTTDGTGCTYTDSLRPIFSAAQRFYSHQSPTSNSNCQSCDCRQKSNNVMVESAQQVIYANYDDHHHVNETVNLMATSPNNSHHYYIPNEAANNFKPVHHASKKSNGVKPTKNSRSKTMQNKIQREISIRAQD